MEIVLFFLFVVLSLFEYKIRNFNVKSEFLFLSSLCGAVTVDRKIFTEIYSNHC